MYKILVLFFLFNIVTAYGENVEEKLELEKIKEKATLNIKENELNREKDSAGISPLFIITILCQSDDDDDDTVEIENADIPLIGSCYAGEINGRTEKLYGVAFNGFKKFEVNYQKRHYYNDECTGFFNGVIVAAGYDFMRTHIENGDVYISNNEGSEVCSFGIRAGGNIGYRFKLSKKEKIYLSTRLGLVLPLHVIAGHLDYDEKQKRELYMTNAAFKMVDFGFHLENVF